MVNIYDPNNTEPHQVSQTFTDKENLFKCDKSEAVSSNISSLKKWILTIIYIVCIYNDLSYFSCWFNFLC